MGVILPLVDPSWSYAALTPVQWIAAVVEVFGILLIARNPLDFFRKKEA